MFNNISQNLKALRNKNNLTQSELAHSLGISRQALSNYEKGTRDPDIFTITKIAKFFNCSIDFLVFNNTTTNITKLYKCSESKELDDFSENIIRFLETKKEELNSIQNSIPDKIEELDNIISKIKLKK